MNKKNKLAAALLFSLLGLNVQAESYATKPGGHALVNVGITGGGDTLATVRYSDGSTATVKAGGRIQLGLGLLLQAQEKPLALQLTANYHYDLQEGSAGSVIFYRYPLEALLYYTGTERWRFGGGLRYVTSPIRTVNVSGTKTRLYFKNATGLVGEVGFAITPNLWMNLRAVSEQYQPDYYTVNYATVSNLSGVSRVNGSHVGLNFSYQF